MRMRGEAASGRGFGLGAGWRACWPGVALGLAAMFAALVMHGASARLDQAKAARYIEHVKVLAAPAMKGRGAGTPELEKAGRYIASQFERYGLEPGARDRSYLQPFTVTTGAELGERNHFVVRSSAGEKSLRPRRDYMPLNFSSSGSVSGPVVFAGYGVSAEEFGYDDYMHFAVEGRIVVLLRYEPEHFQGKLEAAEKRYSHHAHLIAKAINARDHGAKAVILVNGEREAGEPDELVRFGGVPGPEDAGILMLHARNEIADGWLRGAGKSLADVQKEMREGKSPQSFTLADDLVLSIEVEIDRKQATVHNVAGYLPGQTDEYLVIGAHYDHLGLGDESSLAPSKIGTPHLGADDNASGTAGLIELARMFSMRRGTLRRGVLFLAFSGEEIGLLGSSYWVNHPTRPMGRAVGMLNMDMIGRIAGSKVYVGGRGTGSTFEELLKRVQERHDFEVAYSEGGYTASDHTSFVSKQIPVLFFFSGLHGDYHKPSDTWEKINAAKAARLVDMIGDVAGELLEAGARPEFRKVVQTSHGGAALSGDGGGGGRGYGPYFGSVPDFAPVESGVKFADVREGSPAGKAGLRGGDILIEFGEREIKNLYDFTYALRASKVGQQVEVMVLRDGKRVAALVTLERRR